MTTVERDSLLAQANEILKRPNFSREDASRVTSLLELSDRYSSTDLRKIVSAQRDRELGRTPTHETLPSEEQEFRNYLRVGKDYLSQQKRAQSTTTTAGGWLCPQSFSTRLESMLAKTDGLFQVSSLFETATGNAVGYPILEDTGHSAAIVAENGASTVNTDLTFAALAFGKVPMYRSNMIICSVELANDGAFDIANVVADAAGVSFGRGIGAAFVATLLTSATSAGTTAGAIAITSDEIFTLIDAVDEAYAQNGSFLMRQSTLTYLHKLKGSGGAYMFPSERRADGVPMLAGFPVWISPSMGAISTGAKAVSFGDHSRFVRRQVRDSLTVKTYNERYAEYSEIGYEAFWRVDGGLLKSSTTVPVKYLLQA